MGFSDRDELVELMARYADVSDTNDWHDLPLTVFAERLKCDFSSIGTPILDVRRDIWCQLGREASARWAATHHAITGHRVTVHGDRATIRAHVRAEHWLALDRPGSDAHCWLVVGFYDNTAVRTVDGWRLDSITLTAMHQENRHLATMAMPGR